MEHSSQKVSVQTGEVTKISYEPPRIIVLGTLAELTRGKGPGADKVQAGSN